MNLAAAIPSQLASILLGTLVLMAGLATGAMLLRGGRLRRRSTSTAFFAVALGCAVAAGTVVPIWSGSSDTDQGAGFPRQGTVELGAHHVSVLVVPNRPGFNLVAVNAEGAAAGTSRVGLTPGELRPGSTQTWVGVTLPAGRSEVWVSAHGVTGSITVDAGEDRSPELTMLRGVDGPECASSALGTIVAGAAGPLIACPADRLSPSDAEALTSMIGFVAERGERTVALVADGSPRGRAAADTVRAAARRHGLSISSSLRDGHPMVVVSGWQGADTALRDVAAGRGRARGSYLAPWLLTTPLLQPAAGQLVPLRYAPRADEPMRYVTALSRLAPGTQPTAAGYEAWLRARRVTDERPPVLIYAASVARIPGSAGNGGHHGHSRADWLPDGLISPVSGALKPL